MTDETTASALPYFHQYAEKPEHKPYGFDAKAEKVAARFEMSITIKTDRLDVLMKVLNALKETGLYADALGAVYAWNNEVKRHPEVESK